MLQAIQKDGHVKPCMSGKGFWYFTIITYDIQDPAPKLENLCTEMYRKMCMHTYICLQKSF